ncbi:MAG: hypothetical protein HRT47_08355 [Candidatus Caenarcaniphilales bacterium]|nr:hypothetical protein [Candidatus Caenarcaniphilales bacterium]
MDSKLINLAKTSIKYASKALLTTSLFLGGCNEFSNNNPTSIQVPREQISDISKANQKNQKYQDSSCLGPIESSGFEIEEIINPGINGINGDNHFEITIQNKNNKTTMTMGDTNEFYEIKPSKGNPLEREAYGNIEDLNFQLTSEELKKFVEESTGGAIKFLPLDDFLKDPRFSEDEKKLFKYDYEYGEHFIGISSQTNKPILNILPGQNQKSNPETGFTNLNTSNMRCPINALN